MKIEVGRFKKDGRLKATTRHEEQDSNFWKSNLTECLRYDDKNWKLKFCLWLTGGIESITRSSNVYGIYF